MAAQPKGTATKPKAQPEKHPKIDQGSSSRGNVAEEDRKGTRKESNKKKSKGKGKKKVGENPKHVHYAVEGEPHLKMPAASTRGDNHQAGLRQ